MFNISLQVSSFFLLVTDATFALGALHNDFGRSAGVTESLRSHWDQPLCCGKGKEKDRGIQKKDNQYETEPECKSKCTFPVQILNHFSASSTFPYYFSYHFDLYEPAVGSSCLLAPADSFCISKNHVLVHWIFKTQSSGAASAIPGSHFNAGVESGAESTGAASMGDKTRANSGAVGPNQSAGPNSRYVQGLPCAQQTLFLNALLGALRFAFFAICNIVFLFFPISIYPISIYFSTYPSVCFLQLRFHNHTVFFADNNTCVTCTDIGWRWPYLPCRMWELRCVSWLPTSSTKRAAI